MTMKFAVPIYSMIRKDLTQLLHNKAIMINIFLSLLFNLIVPNIITFQVRNINIAMVAHDHSDLSQKIIQDIAYTGDFTIVGQFATYEDALSLVNDGKADCIIEIPVHFERDFIYHSLHSSTNTKKNKQDSGHSGLNCPNIQITANAINSTKVLSVSQNIIGSIALTLTNYAHNHGVVVRDASNLCTVENLYNPSFNYKLLMLPVVFITIMLIFSIATRLMTNEIQYGTIDQINVSPMSRFAYVTSKITTSYIVSMAFIIISMVSLWMAYDFTPHGNMLLVLLALSLYVICCSCIAMILCNISTSISQMILFSSIFSLIAMMMSGYITPLECIAEWLQPVSYLLPPRYCIIILRNVTLKGGDITDLYGEFLILSILTIILFSISVLSFKKSR